MHTTTVNDDTVLLDLLELMIQERGMRIELEHIYLHGSHAHSWKVSFKSHSTYDVAGSPRSVYASGGGTDLRAAIENAVSRDVKERLQS